MLVENDVGLLFFTNNDYGETAKCCDVYMVVVYWMCCVVSKEITCQPHIGISTMEVMCANLCNVQ